MTHSKRKLKHAHYDIYFKRDCRTYLHIQQGQTINCKVKASGRFILYKRRSFQEEWQHFFLQRGTYDDYVECDLNHCFKGREEW